MPIIAAVAIYLSIFPTSQAPHDPGTIQGNETPMPKHRTQHIMSRADPTAPRTSAAQQICYEGDLPLIVLGVIFMVLGMELTLWSGWILVRRRKAWRFQNVLRKWAVERQLSGVLPWVGWQSFRSLCNNHHLMLVGKATSIIQGIGPRIPAI